MSAHTPYMVVSSNGARFSQDSFEKLPEAADLAISMIEDAPTSFETTIVDAETGIVYGRERFAALSEE